MDYMARMRNLRRWGSLRWMKAMRKDREVSLPLVFQCPIIDEGALEALKFDVSALIVVKIWHLKRIKGIRSYSWVQKYLIVTLKVPKFS